MSNSETHCKSECDCYPHTDPETGGCIHESDCHSQVECDEGRWCDKHHEEAMKDHEYLRDIPRYAVFLNDPDAKEEFNQELRDAGRGHLVRP